MSPSGRLSVSRPSGRAHRLCVMDRDSARALAWSAARQIESHVVLHGLPNRRRLPARYDERCVLEVGWSDKTTVLASRRIRVWRDRLRS